MVDAKKVGYIISVCRREKGFTQDELSARLAVTPQAISRWERGNSLPDIDFLPDISRLLDISIDNLLTGNYTPCSSVEMENPQPLPENTVVNLLLPDEIEIMISAANFEENLDNARSIADSLIESIGELRSSMAKEIGIIVPIIRIRDDISVAKDKYSIYFRKRLMFTDDIPEDIKGGKKIADNLKRVITENPERIISHQMVKAIVDNVAIKNPVLIDEMIPARINYGKLRLILAELLKQGKPIKDMITILESVGELLDITENVKELSVIIAGRI